MKRSKVHVRYNEIIWDDSFTEGHLYVDTVC